MNLTWCRGIKLSRNFGKEAALFAGIIHADSQAIIPMDVDFQDPPELVYDLINDWKNGKTHVEDHLLGVEVLTEFLARKGELL